MGGKFSAYFNLNYFYLTTALFKPELKVIQKTKNSTGLLYSLKISRSFLNERYRFTLI